MTKQLHCRHQFVCHGLFPVPNTIHIGPPEKFQKGSYSQALLPILLLINEQCQKVWEITSLVVHLDRRLNVAVQQTGGTAQGPDPGSD